MMLFIKYGPRITWAMEHFCTCSYTQEKTQGSLVFFLK